MIKSITIFHLLFIMRGVESIKMSQSLLAGATSFEQYNINDKLITYIGETHREEINPCTNGQYITTIDYITNRVINEPNTKVLLEYTPGTEIKNENLFKTLHAIANGVDKKQVIPFDIRGLALTSFAVSELYHRPSGYLEKLEKKDFKNRLVKPFYIEYDKLFGIDKNKYSEENYHFLIVKYLQSNILKQFDTIRKEFGNERAELIRNAWMKVADYAILKEILKNDNSTTQYIILAGEMHRRNFADIFRGQRIKGTYQVEKNKCINFYEAKLSDEK